jgi:hypothetical protein
LLIGFGSTPVGEAEDSIADCEAFNIRSKDANSTCNVGTRDEWQAISDVEAPVSTVGIVRKD